MPHSHASARQPRACRPGRFIHRRLLILSCVGLASFVGNSECLGQGPAMQRSNPAHVSPPPINQVPASPYAAPYAGTWNHAQQNPTFRWGWFGAERYAPLPTSHRNYYRQPMRWSTLRSY